MLERLTERVKAADAYVIVSGEYLTTLAQDIVAAILDETFPLDMTLVYSGGGPAAVVGRAACKTGRSTAFAEAE